MTDAERAQLRALADAATSPPWRVATEDDVSDNWLVCIGRSLDGHTYYVTTDHVHASELEGDARNDAEFIAACRLGVPKLVDALASTIHRAEEAEAKLAWMTADRNMWHAGCQQLEEHLAAMTARAEAAEAAALVKGNEWAHAIRHATVFRERLQAAEAKLAAIPTESLTYCWYAEDSEREDDDWERHGNAVGNWLAQLRKEAQP